MAPVKSQRSGTRGPRVAVLAGALALLAAGPARAQGEETPLAQRMARSALSPSGADPVSRFGAQLSDADAGALLGEMRQLVEQALTASRAAEQAGSVAEVKAAADRVFQAVWGMPSGLLADGAAADVPWPGWKERWQVTGAEFDPKFIERYGTQPPQVTDPRRLGVAGRGRAVRGRLAQLAGAPAAPAARVAAAQNTAAALNNVIGWTYVTIGFKVREVQPRISLTHVWDAPVEFWNSTADTGWLYEAQSQAINILKTDYAGDLAEARAHAAAMSELLARVLNGVDADGNGTVQTEVMEGGLNAALREAALAGLRAP